jgi:FixJ family two-component response regulator
MGKNEPFVAIVDDDHAVCKALGRLLRSAGLGVRCWTSGTDFLLSLDERVPDCVVLDIDMPEMTGFSVQAHLGARHPYLPVIFITASDAPADRQLALRGGAVAYLVKPFGDEELLHAISAAAAPPNRS